jgi:hypothetical protein
VSVVQWAAPSEQLRMSPEQMGRHEQARCELVRLDLLRIDSRSRRATSLADEVAAVNVHVFTAWELMPKAMVSYLVGEREAPSARQVRGTQANPRAGLVGDEQARRVRAKITLDHGEPQATRDDLDVDGHPIHPQLAKEFLRLPPR